MIKIDLNKKLPKLQDAKGYVDPMKYKPVVGYRKGARKNPDGSESTHLMSYAHVEDLGGYVAFPTLFQNEAGEFYEPENPLAEALKKNEIYRFGNDLESAKAFAAGNWKPKKQAGGVFKAQDAVPGQSLPGEESPTSGKYPQPSSSIETTPIDRTGEFGFNIIDNTNRVQDQEIILQPAPSNITYTPEPAQNLIDVTPIANVEIDRTGERTDSKEAVEETILNQKNKLAQTYLQNPNTSYKIDKLGSYYQEGIIDEAQYSTAFDQYESYYNEAAEGYNKLLSSGVPMTTFFNQSLPTQQDLIDNPTAYNFDEMEFSYYDLNKSILPQETTIKGVDELLEASQDENFAIALRDPNLTMDNNDALWQKVEAAIYSGYTRDDILAAGMVSAAEYDNHYDASDPETKALFHRTLGLDAKDTEGRAMRAGALRMNYSTQVIDEFVNDFYGYVEDGLNFEEIADLSTSDLYTVQSLETVLPFLKDQVINPSYMEDGNSGNVIDLAKYFVDIEKIGAGINIPEGIYFEGDFNFNPESHLDYVLGTSESETESPRSSHTLQSLAGDLAAAVRTGQFDAEQAKSTFLTMGEAFFLPIRENNEGRVIIDADEYENFSNQLKEIHEGLDFSTLEKEFTTEMAHINDRINSFSESFSSYIDNLDDYINLANQFTEDFSNWAYVDFGFSNRDEAYDYVNSQYKAVYSEYEDIWKNMLVPELVDMPRLDFDGSTVTDDGTPKYFAALNADGATLKRDSRGNVVYMTMEDYLGSPDPQAELQSYDRSFMENVHMALDGIGMVDGFLIGELADLVNAGLYAAEGEYGYASLSLASVVPGASLALAPAKMAKYGKAFLGAVETLPKVTRTSLKGVGYVGLGTLKLAEIAEVAVNPFSAGAKSINMVKRSINAADALKTTTNVGKAAKPFLQDDGSNIVRHLDENGVETTSISRPQNTNTIELRDGEGNLIASTKSDDFSDDMKKMLSSEEAATKGYVIKFLDADGKQLGKGVNTKTLFEATGPSKPEGFPERVTKQDAPSAQTVEGATDAPSAPDAPDGIVGSPSQGSPSSSTSSPIERIFDFFFSSGVSPSDVGSHILTSNKTYKLRPKQEIAVFKGGQQVYRGPVKNAPPEFVTKEGRLSYRINKQSGQAITVSLASSRGGVDISRAARQLEEAIYNNPEFKEALKYQARFWNQKTLSELNAYANSGSNTRVRLASSLNINSKKQKSKLGQKEGVLPGFGSRLGGARGPGVLAFDAKQMAQYGLMKSLDLESLEIAKFFPFRDVDHIESFKDDVYALANSSKLTVPDNTTPWLPHNNDIIYAYDYTAPPGQELKFYRYNQQGRRLRPNEPPGLKNPLVDEFIEVDPNDPRIQNMSYDDWVAMAARSHGNNAAVTKELGQDGSIMNYRRIAYSSYYDVSDQALKEGSFGRDRGYYASTTGSIFMPKKDYESGFMLDIERTVFESLLENVDNIDFRNLDETVKNHFYDVMYRGSVQGAYGGSQVNFHEMGHLMSLSPLLGVKGQRVQTDPRVKELYDAKGLKTTSSSPSTLFDYEMVSAVLGGDYLDDASLALEIPAEDMQTLAYEYFLNDSYWSRDIAKVIKGEQSIGKAFTFDDTNPYVMDLHNFKLEKIENEVLHWKDGTGKLHTHAVPGKDDLSQLRWNDLPTDFKSAALETFEYLRNPDRFFLPTSHYRLKTGGYSMGELSYLELPQAHFFLKRDSSDFLAMGERAGSFDKPFTYMEVMDRFSFDSYREISMLQNMLQRFPENSIPNKFSKDLDVLSDVDKYTAFYLVFNRNEASAYAGELRGKALRTGRGVDYRPGGRPIPIDLTKEDLDYLVSGESASVKGATTEYDRLTRFKDSYGRKSAYRNQQIRDQLLKSFNKTLNFEEGGKVTKHQNANKSTIPIIERDYSGMNILKYYDVPLDVFYDLGIATHHEMLNRDQLSKKTPGISLSDYVEGALDDGYGFYSDAIENAYDRATEFHKDWMNSEMYNKMITESMQDMGVPGEDAFTVLRNYHFDAINPDNQYFYFDNEGGSVGSAYIWSPWSKPIAKYNFHPHLKKAQSRVNVNNPYPLRAFEAQKIFSDELADTMVEEMGHLIVRPFITSMDEAIEMDENKHDLIPQVDEDLINSLRVPLDESGYTKRFYNYLSDPAETRERLSTFRFAASENSDLYDPFTEEATEEDVLKLRDMGNRSARELIRMYGVEGAVELLNSVSQAEPQQEQEENFYAKKGGKVSKKKRDVPMDVNSRIKLDLQQKLGVNVDNLTPIPIGSRGLKEFAKKNPLAVAALGHNPFRVAGSPPRDLLL